MVEREVREELQEFLADEFDNIIDDYLDDVENLIECKSILYSAIQTCTTYIVLFPGSSHDFIERA